MAQDIGIERRLAAVFAADVAGFSRLTEADEIGTMRMLAAQRAILDSAIARHRGRIANTAGDSVLAEFPSAVNAVQCAVEAQQVLRDAAEAIVPDRRILFRIGIHVGDVMVRGGDLLGTGVNVAARLEALADAGGVVISAAAHEQVRKILPLAYTDLGPQSVKNIEEPVRAYAIGAAPRIGAISRPGDGKLPGGDSPPRKSIMVLPLVNLSGDPEQEYFADGLTESLTTDLARFRGLFVIGRNTAFTFKGKPIDIRQAGRDIGVRYVLEGSVQRGGERIRINVQLIEAESNAYLWAERFDRPRADLFQVQDEIARRVAYSLSLQLKEHDLKTRERSDNLESIDLWMQATSTAQAGTHPDKIRTRFELLQRATELDPRNTDAWADLAGNRAVFVFSGWSPSPSEDLRLAEEAVQNALAIEPHHPHALFAKGQVYLARRNYVAALEAYEHARELNPSAPYYHQLVGVALIALGRSEEAFEPLQEAMRLSPRDRIIADFYMSFGWACWELKRFEEALGWLERSVAQNPRLDASQFLLASTLQQLGQPQRAFETIRGVLSISPGWTIARVRSAFPLTEAGREAILTDLRKAGLPE